MIDSNQTTNEKTLIETSIKHIARKLHKAFPVTKYRTNLEHISKFLGHKSWFYFHKLLNSSESSQTNVSVKRDPFETASPLLAFQANPKSEDATVFFSQLSKYLSSIHNINHIKIFDCLTERLNPSFLKERPNEYVEIGLNIDASFYEGEVIGKEFVLRKNQQTYDLNDKFTPEYLSDEMDMLALAQEIQDYLKINPLFIEGHLYLSEIFYRLAETHSDYQIAKIHASNAFFHLVKTYGPDFKLHIDPLEASNHIVYTCLHNLFKTSIITGDFHNALKFAKMEIKAAGYLQDSNGIRFYLPTIFAILNKPIQSQKALKKSDNLLPASTSESNLLAHFTTSFVNGHKQSAINYLLKFLILYPDYMVGIKTPHTKLMLKAMKYSHHMSEGDKQFIHYIFSHSIKEIPGLSQLLSDLFSRADLFDLILSSQKRLKSAWSKQHNRIDSIVKAETIMHTAIDSYIQHNFPT